MTKKTSPSSRPARRPLRPRFGMSRRPAETDVDKRPTTFGGKLRRFLPSIGVVAVLVALVLAVLAVVVVMFSDTPLGALASLIAEMWMISHLSPVVFEGVTVGLVPLLPALGVIALLASRVRTVVRRKVSVYDLGVILGVALVVPMILTLIAWLILWDAARVYPVGAPPILIALANTALVHLVGMVIGVGPKLWRAIFRRYGLNPQLIDGAGHGVRFLTYLAAASVAVMVVLAVAGWGRQQEMIAAYPVIDTAGIAALVALTVLYLPNAAVAGMSVLVGGDVWFGDASVSLFSIHLVPLPPLPLTALVPPTAQNWAPVALVIPAAIAVYLWVEVRPGVWRVLGGALAAGITMLVAVYFASGSLGWYDYVGPTWWIAPLLVLVWVGAVGVVTVVVTLVVSRRGQEEGPEEEEPEAPEEEEEEEEEEDPDKSSPRPAED